MKKTCNFFCKLLALASVIGGLFLVYKKFVACDVDNEFDDEFDDDFDFDDDDFTEASSDTREYVTLNASESKENVDNDDFSENMNELSE